VVAVLDSYSSETWEQLVSLVRWLPNGTEEELLPPTGGWLEVMGCNARGEILISNGGRFELFRDGGWWKLVSPLAYPMLDVLLNEAGHLLYRLSVATPDGQADLVVVDDGTELQTIPGPWVNPQQAWIISFNVAGAMLVREGWPFGFSVVENGVSIPLGVPADVDLEHGDVRSLNDHLQAVGILATRNALGQLEFSFMLWTHVPPSPSAQVTAMTDAVANLIESGELGEGAGAALVMKLNAADRQISSGNVAGAQGQLEGFIRQTAAFIAAGKLDATVGQTLLDAAEHLRANLE
jgi:hypothetical protein